MKDTDVLVVFGTRPEAIKMAPLVKALEATPGLRPVVCVTAQHREMLDQVLEVFDIKPDFDLDLMKPGQNLAELSAAALQGLNEIIASSSCEMVLVHGDTTTAFMGALAAYYNKVPVGHVEAGLRTYDKYAPYPEEMNREFIGRVADLHFAPTVTSALQLAAENRFAHVHVTGNTVIDSLQWTIKDKFDHPLLQELDSNKKWILLTMHRRENWGAPMEAVFQAVARVAEERDDVEFIFPVHPNPAIVRLAEEYLGGRERIHLCSPLDVVAAHNFMARSHFVLTDSGGIQEEAPSLAKPVLVLRDKTERPEGVEAGTLRCIGTNKRKVYTEIVRLLDDDSIYRLMSEASNPYGDGYASERIAQAVFEFLHP
ncbi:UDP-N-acetylglucosamine 2-epimerase (non-hydrolyzing) [Paenibacillus shirakamiensis]|uniref:UDP-N-acetylglucosamine 2-epimerase (non-hydrolyzing) n=1 Tax=Paenibacillus shirakamiensis TaxID=1265935 RepID=A0ABS4JI10_9BACL|nr:UDP-N-acetylglucosamine 2-epimerase (non-hydrolyzing) [Paenibacillus shirakamiensis]MBP2001343.1 UDP-N-acetylglucosamine 2-epimerase (non-hydrolyzing) [Paenibacillus shirakamiensis]